jgi:serine/threonine protein phosphatase 1
MRWPFTSRRPPAPAPGNERHLSFPDWPAAVYAIGDVHGCADQLRRLLAVIAADAAGFAGDKWIVGLGDYVDRGPQSSTVLDLLTARPPPGFRRFCLAGNHEAMMLDFWDHPADRSGWLGFGGIETLYSYGIGQGAMERADIRGRRYLLDSHIPSEHRYFLDTLPLTLSLPGLVLVHAGIRRGIPLRQQAESDLLWIRHEFFDAPADDGLLVVHGHTPGSEPVIAPHRICVDTGAFATGRLTSVRLRPDEAPYFLTSDMEQSS